MTIKTNAKTKTAAKKAAPPKLKKPAAKKLVLHRRNFYLVEQDTIIRRQDNRLWIIDDKTTKTLSLSSHLIDEKTIKAIQNKKQIYPLAFAATSEGCQIYDTYKEILDFSKSNPKFNIAQFDKALKDDLVLCTFFKHCDLDYINSLTGQISLSIPYLIEVFRRPVTHLIEIETIVPVDTAKHITSKTVRHLMSHSENWECIKKGRIVPKNVLTKTYDDDYGIYENVVFVSLINKILKLLKRQLRLLAVAGQIYNDAVAIDVFSRINHEQYYQAVGLLYSGFFNMEEDIEGASAATKRIKQLLALLAKYLSHPVYAKNMGAKAIKGQIKQTNILLMHKDYKHIYALWQKLGSGEDSEDIDDKVQAKGQRAYEVFIKYMMLFAIKHFNFDEKFEFKKWTISIKDKKTGVQDINGFELIIKYKRKGSIKYLIVPNAYYLGTDRTANYQYLTDVLGTEYNKIIFCEPFEDESGFDYWLKSEKGHYFSVLPVSILELNSFRRFQKLLLECMVESDNDRIFCAFCGGGIVEDRCKRCRLVIENIMCKNCGFNFKATRADGIKNGDNGEGVQKCFFEEEKRYLFKNITNIKDGAFVCRNCGE